MGKDYFLEYPFQVDIIYSKRKSIEIRVVDQHTIQLRAPYKASYKRLKTVLNNKINWITKHLNACEDRREKGPGLKIGQDEIWPFFGKEYTLDLQINQNYEKLSVYIEDSKLNVQHNNYDEIAITDAISNLYKNRLRKYISQRIEFFYKPMDVKPKGFRIKSQKSLWGSCSSQGNLNFNWKIAFAPETVIDYLIVHEMAHLKHMNHQQEFWGMVRKFSPDYKSHKQWLKEHNYLLKEL